MISRRNFISLLGTAGLFLAAPTEIFALTQKKRRKRKRKVIIPDSPRPVELKPLHLDRINQNNVADKLGIPVIWDESVIKQMRLTPTNRSDSGLKLLQFQLVPSLHSPYLTAKSSYTYSWVNDLLAKFGQEQYLATKKRILINSFYRTVQTQRNMFTPRFKRIGRGRKRRLKQINKAYNPYAAKFYDENNEVDEDLISLHCRAVAIDISRRNLTLDQIEWIRVKLIALKKLDIGVSPIEERTKANRINCFHVVIFDPVEYKKLIASKVVDTKLPVVTPAPAGFSF